MSLHWISEIGALLFMAFALGLDGFSVSLGIGLQPIRLKRIALIGLVIGVFHVILPFFGLVIGHFISMRLEYITTIIGSFILVFIGCYIMFSALQTKKENMLNPRGFKLFSIALLVSVDSFPVGLSLGLSGIQTMMVIFLFGFTAMAFSWAGMLLGRKTHQVLGTYSELIGGLILLLFGLFGVFS